MIRWLGRGAFFLCILVTIILLGFYLGFRASLPVLEGNIESSKIIDAVLIERDQSGYATITAGNRTDMAYAMGFIHAQERFFQMDLSRRMAAGELSELFGEIALNTDRDNRLHRFRFRAKEAIKLLSSQHKELLEHYVAGVNHGLKKLGSKPFEYWLLGTEPKNWTEEDSFLVIYSMFFTLQNSKGDYEWQNHLLRKSLHQEIADFLLPLGTEWDAPLQEDETGNGQPKTPLASLLENKITLNKLKHDDDPMLGSSNWAVSGALTSTGAAMLSNDMHLTIRAPSIWYKLRLKVSNNNLDVTGVSLPGAPAIVVGSNGSVAWGFTNSNIDTSDIIELKINPENDNQYLTVDGYEDFTEIVETINMKGGSTETFSIKETTWGPVMDFDQRGSYAYRWVAHLPDAVNMSLINMEQLKSVEEVLKNAGTMGMPAQNAVLVDKEGNLAWTLFGKIPRRGDADYHKVLDWSDGTKEWNGWYSSEELPKVYNPENNRLWTANARVLSGADLDKVGVGRYDLGARAKQIKDRLFALPDKVTEQDLYKIMLDDEAVFLSRWQKQLLSVLKAASDDWFEPYISEIENWNGLADKDSVGFRLVREYRYQVYAKLMGVIVNSCVQYDPNCNYDAATKQWEGPLWQLVSEEPNGWLPDQYESWQFFFEKMAFEAWQPVILGEITLAEYVWGKANESKIAHPLSRAVPFLDLLTDMPSLPQSGDTENIPHITGNTRGQSERIVVSPGHEETGIMDIPAGQSGHPLSPYYGAGHDDWMEGNATPFLPQETKWKMHLIPID